jgi:UDP-N-acetyl-D-mannosaminuronic acid dehydrogenase
VTTSSVDFRTVAVVGLGYIGLPTAAMFASRGLQVVGIDTNQRAVETINRGEIHIVEPDLDVAVRDAVAKGYLRATTLPEPADAFLIAVPTPFKGANHDPDLGYIEAASRAIAAVLKSGDLVVLESTSPVGATEQMARWLAEERPDLSFPATHGTSSDIRIAHCPERVLPGKVMAELTANDRVIGGATPLCAERARSLYRLFVTGECVLTDCRTAEMAKLAENSFRDVNIAFANELSLICDRLDIDVWELIRLANRHPRVNILQPGPGVGGHCIAVDPWFIVSSAPEQARLIRTAREVNDSKPGFVLDKVENARIAAGKARPVVACLGLAFKPDIDDLRESPAMAIAEALAIANTCDVLIAEPFIEALPVQFDGRARLVSTAIAIAESDILVVLVDHSEFRGIDVSQIAAAHVIDTRGLLRSQVT